MGPHEGWLVLGARKAQGEESVEMVATRVATARVETALGCPGTAQSSLTPGLFSSLLGTFALEHGQQTAHTCPPWLRSWPLSLPPSPFVKTWGVVGSSSSSGLRTEEDGQEVPVHTCLAASPGLGRSGHSQEAGPTESGECHNKGHCCPKLSCTTLDTQWAGAGPGPGPGPTQFYATDLLGGCGMLEPRHGAERPFWTQC